MHYNPRASDDEQEEAHEGRQQEEESMRYPEHHELGKRMERQEIAPGTVVVREGEPGDRFYVVFAGMLAVRNSLGPRQVLRPGDYFGEVALAMDMPRTATVTAITPAVVASCDRATFDEILRPLFADDA